ncbi:MAG: HPF/RaiA family ribosome-associated protein [Bacteroidota bacterium]
MNYTENYRGIKIDVQSVNLDLNPSIQEEIRASIDRLIKFGADINAVDLYFKSEGHGSTAVCTLGMRVGIPGPDVFSEEKGDNWVQLLKSVTDKNIRQVQKNK